MTFGVNLIPSQDNTYSLGNSTNKWNVYADTINGVDPANLGILKVTCTTPESYNFNTEINVSNMSHTYAQITAALSANKQVVLYDTSKTEVYHVSRIVSSGTKYVEFSCLDHYNVTQNFNNGDYCVHSMIRLFQTDAAKKRRLKIYCGDSPIESQVDTVDMTYLADVSQPYYAFEHPNNMTFMDLNQNLGTGYTHIKIAYRELHNIDPSDPEQGEYYTAPIFYHPAEWEEEENTSEPDQPIYHAKFFAIVKNSSGAHILKYMTLTSIGDYAYYPMFGAQITVTMSEITVPGVPVAVSQGGTGATNANTALANLTSVFPYNGDWKTAPIGLSLWYYDTGYASAYDVPSGASFVVVIRHTYSNAVAMCFKYTSNPQYMGWNRMNGNTWSGWDHLVLTGSLSSNNSTYINTVSGSWERHDKVVTFTCQFTMKTAITTSLSTAISGLPASTKMSTFLVNADAAFTANTQRTVSVYNGYLYLGGPFSTGVTYTVSGSYII